MQQDVVMLYLYRTTIYNTMGDSHHPIMVICSQQCARHHVSCVPLKGGIQKSTHPWLYEDGSAMSCKPIYKCDDDKTGIFPSDKVLIEYIKSLHRESVPLQKEDFLDDDFLCSPDLNKAWLNLSNCVTCIDLDDSDTNGIYLL